MDFKKWLERNLSKNIPHSVIAFNFNLYESELEGQYEAQLVGCDIYDPNDDNWACNASFSSCEDLYTFTANDWEVALSDFIGLAKAYLTLCDNSNRLKQARFITAGFVDGDLEIIKND